MARRRLLTREALARQFDPPTDEREIARHFTLSREDLDWVSIRRGPASQLGYAMTLLYMRWPGRVLGADETPPASVLSFVARQLDVPEAAWRPLLCSRPLAGPRDRSSVALCRVVPSC